MAEPIVLLVDYKFRFGSKYAAAPYRSGMDLDRLRTYFAEAGLDPEVIHFPDVDFRRRDWKGTIVLYTSSEDEGGLYKSYIEDIVLGLELAGARVVPSHRLLRAHDNKVFMEILRDLAGPPEFGGVESSYYGALEDWDRRRDHVPSDDAGPTVVKPAAGSLGRGVGLALGPGALRAKAEGVSRSRDLRRDLWDLGRSVRHPGYVRESRNRRKFITQTFVSGLDHDWKVLVFGDRSYAIRRDNRDHDFRASGGGKLSYVREPPTGLLGFAERVFLALDVPHVSLDIGVAGDGFVLFEFQAVYFGTYALDRSPFHFVRGKGGWSVAEGPSELERVYVDSVVRYLDLSTRR